jgi:hypothetical protein
LSPRFSLPLFRPGSRFSSPPSFFVCFPFLDSGSADPVIAQRSENSFRRARIVINAFIGGDIDRESRGFSMNCTAVAVAGGDGQGTRQYTTGVVHDDLLRAAVTSCGPFTFMQLVQKPKHVPSLANSRIHGGDIFHGVFGRKYLISVKKISPPPCIFDILGGYFPRKISNLSYTCRKTYTPTLHFVYSLAHGVREGEKDKNKKHNRLHTSHLLYIILLALLSSLKCQSVGQFFLLESLEKCTGVVN